MQRSYNKMNDKSKFSGKIFHGDQLAVAEIMGVSNKYVHMLLKRPGAKRHQEAVDIMNQIIESREQLKEANRNKES